MKLYGLIGFPLSHSFSASYFADKFEQESIEDAEYRLFPLAEIADLTKLISSHENLCGLNVTIPYKKEIIPYLSHLDPTAAEIGAVNTVKIVDRGVVKELHGYNTDILGFERSLVPLLNHRKKALILGTGGAAMAVAFVLERLQIPFLSVSRTASSKAISYEEIDQELLNDHTLIINTTPIGMHPHVDEAPPIPYAMLNSSHLLYDLVYNPETTLFMKTGLAQGCQVKNGLEMLQIQAEEAWKIWTVQ